MSLTKVIDYYNQAHLDYEWVWRTHKNLSLHYGFYDQAHRTHHEALLNMNRVLANMAHIESKDKVLDAGCGIGGSSIWLAKNLGANVMGVNINESQLSKARALAEINGIQSLVHFIRRNFSDTGLESNSFDVVWGLESICYAEDKKVFLGEAKRVLKNNGRIVVADGFLKKSDLTKKERREMDIWLEGWAVPNLAEAQSFKKDLEELGFRNIVFKDITENVMPSSRRMYWAAVLAYPIAKLMCLVGLRTEVQLKNMDAAYYQQITLRDRLWFYGVFCATK